MEKRVVLFLVLSLGIIFGYDLLLKELGYSPFSTLPILDQEISPPETPEPTTTETLPSTTQETLLDEAAAPTDLTSDQATDTPPTAEEIVYVDTPLYRAGISNQGGVLTLWELKEFLTQTEEPVPVELMYTKGQFPGPLSLNIGSNENATQTLQQGLFRVEKDFSALDEQQPSGKVVLTYGSEDSEVWVQKELTFHYDSYVVDTVVRTRGISESLELVLGTNFGVVEWGQGFIGAMGPAWMIGELVEKESPEPEEPRLTREGPVSWLALQDKYFLSAFIPENSSGLFSKLESDYVVSAGVSFPAGSGEQVLKGRLYAGPKQFDLLKSFEIGLEDTIDFGWFIFDRFSFMKVIAKPLFSVLRYINDYTNNYGVAIILLTVVIKLLFVPLQYKSHKSMKGLQKLQPQVAKLQEKYKDDKQKQQTEMMKLYREHKVNPLGGCLPMVLQMPVFIALFNILYMTIELRQAPFILWITDLSIGDPFYVLPVLMGASMFVQQKMMPTTADPNMAKMMLIMPIALPFVMAQFPAGLVLYWATQNVLTILQQFVTDRYILKKPEPALVESQGPKEDSSAVGSDKPRKKKSSSSQSGKSKKA